MNLPNDSRYTLALNPLGTCEPIRQTSGLEYFLGFDREGQRLVEVVTVPETLSPGLQAAQVLRERLALARTILHPGIIRLLDSGEQAGRPYFVQEFIDGEPLADYAKRTGALPRHLATSLAIQLCDIVALLIDYPRLLSGLRPEDLAVSLERGWLLTLRLTTLGLDRPESPVRDAELAARWVRHVGTVLESLTQGRPLAFDVSDAGLSVVGPMTALEQMVRRQPGVLAVAEVKRLKHTVLHGLGFTDSQSGASPHHHPAFRAVGDSTQVPRGPLYHLLMESGDLRELLAEKYEMAPSSALDWSPYRIEAAIRHATPAEPPLAERAQIHILPPDRLLDGTGHRALNQKMGHPYLKEHPNLVRTRSLASGDDFTLVADEPVRGFSLMNLVTARGHLSPEEALLVLRQIDRALSHFQSAAFDPGRLDPWWIICHFEETASPHRLRELIAGGSLADWPTWEVKFRVSQVTEVFVQTAAGSWPQMEARLADLAGAKENRPTSLLALVAWMMEADRLDWQLTENLWTDGTPFCQNRAFDQYLRTVSTAFDPRDRLHRERLLAEMRHCYQTHLPSPQPILSLASPTGELTFSAA